MTRQLCRVVPVVFCALSLAACFGSHGSTDDGGTDSGGPSDGGVDSGRTDTGTPPDGGTVTCPTAPLDLVCNADTVVAGMRQDIEVLMGGEDHCYCGESVECVARRGAEPNTLTIDAGLCSDGPLCDACFPYVAGSCSLPPLEAGPWRVVVNGDPAFELNVNEPGILPEWGLACVRPARVEDPSCGISWPPVTDRHDQVCHPTAVYTDSRVEIEVTTSCGSCGESAGPCHVEIFDDVIRVRPSTAYSGCDIDCPAVCIERTDVCVTPPLPAGTWRLIVEGTVDLESTIVSTTDPGVDPGDLCLGATSGGSTGGSEP